MKKEKIILAILSLAMIAGSMLGLSVLIEHIQGQEVVERIETAEGKTGKAAEGEAEQAGITEKPFQVLVSGLDLTSSMKKKRVGRSDLNLLLTVNPVSKKILITNISRDTYLEVVDPPEMSEEEEKNLKANGLTKDQIKGIKEARKNNPKTKLCHVSLYGTSTLVKTVEGFLDTKIDYYVQTTMAGFRTLIDAIGGVDVEAVESFQTDWDTSFKKGSNHVNGKKAATFIRERHHFNEGELRRGKNGIEMMRAIIDKLCHVSLLEMDADKLYQLWKDNVKTDMGAGEVLSLLRMQVEDRAEWEFTSAQIKGEEGREKLMEYQQHEFYVWVPDPASIEKVQKKMADVCQIDS